MGTKEREGTGTKMSTKDNVHGEGNYEASRQYNKATKEFVESGKVEEAARAAAPVDAREASELKAAEAAGLERAKEDDIALKGKDVPGAKQGTKGGVKANPSE
ncbi:MAG: hypothetical protein WKH97_18590 [Casimicrobiaceae bacterium]